MTEDKKMPGWLRRQIEAENPLAFSSKNARWVHCRKCDHWTLAGWDQGHNFAGHFTIDPTALDSLGEATALGQGRTTHRLLIDPKDHSKIIEQRDQWQIRAHPPEELPDPVCPSHVCGSPLGAPIPPEQLHRKKD